MNDHKPRLVCFPYSCSLCSTHSVVASWRGSGNATSASIGSKCLAIALERLLLSSVYSQINSFKCKHQTVEDNLEIHSLSQHPFFFTDKHSQQTLSIPAPIQDLNYESNLHSLHSQTMSDDNSDHSFLKHNLVFKPPFQCNSWPGKETAGAAKTE